MLISSIGGVLDRVEVMNRSISSSHMVAENS